MRDLDHRGPHDRAGPSGVVRRRAGFGALAGAAAVALLAACGDGSGGDGAAGVLRLEAWAHAGREAERRTLVRQVDAFNARAGSVRIDLTLLPEGEYDAQVQAAALADELPDLLEFDGPFVYNYVWQGHLVPIGPYVPQELRDDLLPSIVAQGTYRDRLWTLGQYDSGLALYARRGALEAVGARLPAHPDSAWTADEFADILRRLAARDPDGQVLDLKLNYRGEWFTYAFAPVLWSAGAGLVARGDPPAAGGTLDAPAAVDALTRLQRWIDARGYVDPNVDDHAFVGGRVALSWVGHWEYARYAAAVDDLVLVPLPDFGAGSRTGQGSWNWGVTRRCADPAAAVGFVTYLLEDDQVLEMTRANDAVPATRGAVARSARHRPGGPLRLHVEQLTRGHAVPRPRTPAYPVITAVFQQAFDDLRHGADAATVLERAAAAIDRDIRDNAGYPPRTGGAP